MGGNRIFRKSPAFFKFINQIKKYILLFTIGIKSIFNYGPFFTYKVYKRWKRRQIDLNTMSLSTSRGVDKESEMKRLRYENWCVKNFIDLKREEDMMFLARAWDSKPKFSLLMPVFNTPEINLRKAINSVLDQIYSEWELCIFDNGSSDKIIDNILNEYVRKDKRIKIKKIHENINISDALNEALSMSSGDFICLFNPNDILSRNALWENAQLINQDNNVDFIYSDHDEIDSGVISFNPMFKPDWSPELIISYDYTGPFKVFNKKILNQLGCFKSKYKACCEYDLILRLMELTDKIKHIATVLYHKRVNINSSLSVGAKEELKECGKLALEDHFKRLNIKATVEVINFIDSYSLSLYNMKFSKNDDKISIIIPTKDNYDFIFSCINSILVKTNNELDYEIIVVDSGTTDQRVLAYYNELGSKIKLLKIVEEKFSFAYVNNEAVKKASGKYIVFMNNDVEVIAGDWLEQMRGIFDLSDKIGAVGSKLLYKNNTIQHAGVVLGIYGTADHAFRGLNHEGDNLGYMFFPNVIRNYSACTAACLMVRKDLFMKVGGFDEKLALAYNDVDLCLKLLKDGYRIVYNPNSLLYHHEMGTRKVGEYEGETDYLLSKWDFLINKDPYYNINLTKRSNSFLIKDEDEKEKYTAV